jgi:hypothetical protein
LTLKSFQKSINIFPLHKRKKAYLKQIKNHLLVAHLFAFFTKMEI